MTKGFTVIREERISYYKGTGTFLKHDRTGFKVFYFKPDKGNSNCFSYWFNTPVKDSTGVAHALEHVVLQGSERYPVKNVFPHLRERSVAKSIGAGTGQHYTEFQAETYVAKDYFRLLEIFGDTVFFPLITQNAFNQEVWRFDLDENGRPFINGVVFNEMSSKNKISSFYQDNNVKSKLYKGSENEFISGGSFLEIPELTREALVEFHKKNYTPGNCILFLYGKIDLDEQLSFLEEKLLCRLPENTKEIPIKDELIPLPPLSQIEVCTPFKGVEECSVVFNVICRDDSVEDYRERDFILDRIGALLKKKLKYSEIGKFFEKRDGTPRHSCFEFGLDSVKKENVEKAKAVLLETLEHCLDDGMDYEELRAECNRKDLDFECPDVDFPDKEIAYKIYSGNVESGNPFKYIFEMEEEWEKLKAKVLSYDDEDFRNRLREYLLDNPNKSFCVLTPDRKYYENIEIERKKKLESKLAESGLSVEEIRKSKIAFENYLEEDESNLVSELFPMLDIKDLSDFDDAGLDDVDKVSSKCGDVYLFSSKQETEGLAVISICFALDNLPQDEYKQLKWVSPFFRNLGIDGKSSIESNVLLKKTGISESNLYGSSHSQCGGKEIYENRTWYKMIFRCSGKNIRESLSLINKLIFSRNFGDAKDRAVAGEKLKQLLKRSDISDSERFADSKLNSFFYKFNAYKDECSGVSVLETKKENLKMNVDLLMNRLQKIYEKIISGSAVINFFCNEGNYPAVNEAVRNFIKESEIKPLEENKLKFLYEKIPETERKVFSIITPVSSGSLLVEMNSSEYPSREFAAEKVLLLWFGRHVLFEELRKHHGAYGCTAGICNNTNTIRIDSARDPDPNKALSIVEKCLAQLSELGECKAITEDFVKDQILKTLSKELGDIRPYIKGRSSFESRLNGLSPNLRKTLIKHIHELTLQDFIEAGKRIAEKSKNLKACIITGDEGQACGEVICNFRKINDETE